MIILRNLFLLIVCSLNALVANQLIDTAGTVHPSLITLFSQLNTPIEKSNLAQIVAYTQKEWLRSKGQERWQLQEKYAEHRNEILQCMNDLGCIQEVHAQRKEYDIAVVLGATYFRMKDRINYLISEYNRGIRFKELVFLSGQRPLDPVIEHDVLQWAHNSQPLATESDAMHYIVEHTEFPFSDIKKTFIDVPMIKNGDAIERRPTSEDTFYALLKQYPAISSCLLVSNQPYTLYQDTVARLCLPYHIETIGSQADSATSNAEYLDNIARALYATDKLIAKQLIVCTNCFMPQPT